MRAVVPSKARDLQLLVAALALSACGDKRTTEEPATSEPVVIVTIGSQFVPSYVEVAQGTVVQWDIGGNSEGHDITFNPGIPGTPANIPVTFTAKVNRTFSTKGTFPYECKVHPGMIGEVVVK